MRANEKTRRLTGLALMTAIIIVLQVVASFIKFGPFTITLALALWRTAKARRAGGAGESGFSLKKVFPTFILFFVLASVITTAATAAGVDAGIFAPFKELSKFLIIMAMGAIGLNTDLVKLVKTGGKPIFMGFCCWVAIAGVSLLVQHLLGIW